MKLLQQFRDGTFGDPATPVGALVYALGFGLLAWLVGRALRLAVHRLLSRDKHAYVDRTAVKFLGQLAQIGVYLFAFISYAHIVPALSSLGTAWLASVSVISVIVGLAAQNTLGNLIAGISLLLYRPFELDDRLQVLAPTGLETGVVESLNLGYTILRTDDNRRIVVPNSVMASQTTVNLTAEDPRAVCSLPISLEYAADIDRARAILLDLAQRHPKTQKIGACPVTQMAGAGVVLTLSVWCAHPGETGELKNDLLEQARKQFAANGIELAVPRTKVIMEGDARGSQPDGGRVPSKLTAQTGSPPDRAGS